MHTSDSISTPSGKPLAITAESLTLLDVKTVAKLLGVCTRFVWKMAASGEMPAPIRVGPRLARWRASELRQWIEGGCKPITKRGK